MSEKKPTTLVAPDGQRFDVPSTGVAQLKAKGFRDLNEAELKDVELQKKYGEGILPPIGAAAAGAARTLTFGGSDLALGAIDPSIREGLNELHDRQPGWTAAGEVGALAIPIAGQLAGASTAGTVARAAGAGITGVNQATNIIGHGVQAVAKGAGLDGIAPILGGAAQAAAEGVAFQVGTNLGAAARRDVKLDAETLLAHTGEAAIFGAGFGAAIPAASKVAKWSAEKALSGLEAGAQGLRRLGFGVADLGVDAVEAGAGVVARNADNIGGAIEAGAKATAGALDAGADAIVRRADDIGGAVQGAGQKIAQASDDVLLPRIRKGLTEQTGRADIIDEVFATGAGGQALRKELGPQTITGTREIHAEALGKSLNTIWEQSLDNAPMFDDLALALKKEAQAAELAGSGMSREAQLVLAKSIATEAGKTFEQLGKFNKDAATIFKDAIDDFVGSSLVKPSPESIYTGLDRLKGATDRISQWSKGATGDMSIGAGAAADAARNFRTFAKTTLEDTTIWGAAGQLQQEGNSLYSKYRRAFDQVEKQFAAPKAKGQPSRVLDGGKIKKYAKDITGQPGEVRNVAIDDLVKAQTDLIAFTDRLAKQAQQQAKEAIGSTPATLGAVPRRAAHEGIADTLSRSAGAIDNLAATKATATKELDRAEVLQQTQSAILSRQGAGVNPLPVDIAQKIGGGALVGGFVGGLPGAVIGGGVTSALQKYGAITSNPKSAIEFLNTIDRLRGIEKERVASWIKTTLGETSEQGARAGVGKLAAKVDGKAIGASIRRGAESTQAALPGVRSALLDANKATAKKLLEARKAAQGGVAGLSSRLDAATPGIMQRLLPAASYADVTHAPPDQWWKQTQKAITGAQSDQKGLVERLEKDVSGISDTLPDTAAAISEQQMRVLGYLADKMPRCPRPHMLGTKEWTPSKAQLKAYRDLVLVATKPDALLPLLTAGLGTRAQIDAVRELWPRKFKETQDQVTRAVMSAAADGTPVPYKSRIRLGQLLGVALDPSQEPGFSQWVQADAAQEQTQDDAMRGSLSIDTDQGLPMSARAAERK